MIIVDDEYNRAAGELTKEIPMASIQKHFLRDN